MLTGQSLMHKQMKNGCNGTNKPINPGKQIKKK